MQTADDDVAPAVYGQPFECFTCFVPKGTNEAFDINRESSIKDGVLAFRDKPNLQNVFLFFLNRVRQLPLPRHRMLDLEEVKHAGQLR